MWPQPPGPGFERRMSLWWPFHIAHLSEGFLGKKGRMQVQLFGQTSLLKGSKQGAAQSLYVVLVTIQ